MAFHVIQIFYCLNKDKDRSHVLKMFILMQDDAKEKFAIDFGKYMFERDKCFCISLLVSKNTL